MTTPKSSSYHAHGLGGFWQKGVVVVVDKNGDNMISAEELVKGVSRLKGPARSLDIAALIKDTTRLRNDVTLVKEQVSPFPCTGSEPLGNGHPFQTSQGAQVPAG